MGQESGYADEVDIRQYIEVLWRGKWVILAVTLCAMLSAGLVSTLLLDPSYESSTILAVNAPAEIQTELADPVIASIIGSTPQAHVRLLRDHVVLERAAESIGGAGLDAAALAGKTTAKVVGDATRGDRLVEITARDSVPENAKTAAEAIVAAYREHLSELVSARLHSLREAVRAQLAAGEAEVAEKLERLKTAIEGSGGMDLLEQKIGTKYAELANYRWEHAQLTSEARATSESLKVLEEQLAVVPQTVQLERASDTGAGRMQISDAGALAPVQVNPAHISLVEDVALRRASLAETEARLAVVRDAIPAVEAEIADLKVKLVEEAVLEERLVGEVNAAAARVSDLAARLQYLEGRDAEALVGSAIGIVAPATLPRVPSGPRRLLNVAIAGVLGAMAGVFGVFVMDFWRNTELPAGPKKPVAR